MKADAIKLVFSYLIATFLIGGAFYALVLYPYALDTDVKLWLTAASGTAMAFVFADQIAARSRIDQQSAFSAGLGATPTAAATFTCSIDAQMFPDQASLDQHMATVHPATSTYP